MKEGERKREREGGRKREREREGGEDTAKSTSHVNRSNLYLSYGTL